MIAGLLTAAKGLTPLGWVQLLWKPVLVLVLVLVVRSHWIGVGEDRVQGKFDAYKAKVIAATERARDAAKRAEAVQAGAIAAATDKLKQDNADARAKADRTIADLRAGALRLQPRFKCPARHLPGTPAGSEGSQPAGEGGLSDQDAEFLIRFASGADAAVNQLTACQSILKADRP